MLTRSMFLRAFSIWGAAVTLTVDVRAQSPAPAGVNIHVKFVNVDIRTALKALSHAFGETVTADADVSATVSVDFLATDFRSAMIGLLKSGSRPLYFYNSARGGYSVGNAKDPSEAGWELAVDYATQSHLVTVPLNFTTPADMARALRGDRRSFVPKGIQFAQGHANSILVWFDDDARLREFKEVIRLLDVAQDMVELKTELVMEVRRGQGKKTYGIIRMVGQTDSEKPLTLRSNVDRAGVVFGKMRLEGCTVALRTLPRVLGDSSVQMDTDWSLDLSLRVGQRGRPARIARKSIGTIRVSNPNTVALARSVVKLGNGKDAFEGELTLFVTPSVIREPLPHGIRP